MQEEIKCPFCRRVIYYSDPEEEAKHTARLAHPLVPKNKCGFCHDAFNYEQDKLKKLIDVVPNLRELSLVCWMSIGEEIGLFKETLMEMHNKVSFEKTIDISRKISKIL